MAVTIHSNPDEFTPSDNPIVWTFSSDQTGQANFSFIVELYIDGVLDSNSQVFPEVDNYAHFDAEEKTTGLTPSPSINQTSISADASNTRLVNIKVYERYGTPPTNQAFATSAVVNPFKACISNEQMQIWDSDDYKVGFPTSKFLTDLDDIISIRTGADYYLSIITDEWADLTAEIAFKDITGATVTTHSEPISNVNNFTQLMLNLDKMVVDGVLTQLQADSTETVEVYILRQALNVWSETKIFSINRECGNRGRHLIWLNHLGGFDQFTFTHNDTQTTKTKSNSYRKQFGNWQGTNFVLDAYNAGDIGYITTSDDSIELVSNWITQSVQNWLVASSYEGVLVTIQTALETYSRVTIDTNSYKLEDDFFEELINVIIKLKLSNARRSPKV